METAGIEPASPRCDRGVLPLYDVPVGGIVTDQTGLFNINLVYIFPRHLVYVGLLVALVYAKNTGIATGGALRYYYGYG
jgi:hypothetical protein